jgi:hypothetical protein
MPGQEGHPAAGHLADQDRLARLPERRLDLDLVAIGEKLVEARTPDDPDVRDGGHGRQATFSPEEPAEELADEAFSPPEDGEEAFSPPEDEEDCEDEDGEDEDEDGESGEDPAADEDVEDGACAEADDPFRLSVR